MTWREPRVLECPLLWPGGGAAHGWAHVTQGLATGAVAYDIKKPDGPMCWPAIALGWYCS